MKMVINKCYGGFGLSHEAIMRYAELKGITLHCVEKKGKDTWENKKYHCVDKPKSQWTALYVTKPLNEDGSYVEDSYWYYGDLERTDPILVQVVEELGEKADGQCASLKVVDIPDDLNYTIEEYDGIEWVAEKHQTWG